MSKDTKPTQATPGPWRKPTTKWRRFGGAGDGYGIASDDGGVVIPQSAYLKPLLADDIVRDHNAAPQMREALEAAERFVLGSRADGEPILSVLRAALRAGNDEHA